MMAALPTLQGPSCIWATPHGQALLGDKSLAQKFGSKVWLRKKVTAGNELAA